MAFDTTRDAVANPKSKIQNPKYVLALVCVAIFVGAIDLTVVSAVLPKIMADLGVSLDTELNRGAWAVSGYLLAYTVSMSFMGRLSDLYGRRALYLVCLAIFIVGSALVAAANSLALVVIGRVVQAFGAGSLVPISLALVGDLFPPERRAPALGVIGAVDTAGWMVGHLYGGLMMTAFDDWRLIFWLNLPIGLVALALTWWALRGVTVTRASGGFDWLGALLIGACLIALNVGLAAGSEQGAADFYGNAAGPPPYAWPLVGLAALLLVAFIWQQRRAAHPLLDLPLLRDRSVAAACAINALTGFALALALTNVPLFVTTRQALFNYQNPDVLRDAAFDSGWLLSALTLTMAALAVPGGWLATRLRERWPTLLGLALALAGCVVCSRWAPDTSYLVMAGGLMLAGAGLGLVLSPVAETVVGAASPEHRGSAAALVITLRLVGMTIGVGALTLYGTQRQDALRRAGADNPLAASEPNLFLMGVAAQVVGEMFLFGAVACLVAILPALLLKGRRKA
jgi:EmrB/QacA subfamily drug resistance transporter